MRVELYIVAGAFAIIAAAFHVDSIVRAEVDVGAVAPVMDVEPARQEYVEWQWQSGPTKWQQQRQRDVRAVTDVGRAKQRQ